MRREGWVFVQLENFEGFNWYFISKSILGVSDGTYPFCFRRSTPFLLVSPLNNGSEAKINCSTASDADHGPPWLATSAIGTAACYTGHRHRGLRHLHRRRGLRCRSSRLQLAMLASSHSNNRAAMVAIRGGKNNKIN